MKHKILVVGSGLYGSVLASELAKKGYFVDVLDKRNHFGGNCYTEIKNNIPVHKYGPHIFHTNNQKIWSYMNGIVKFNNKKQHTKVIYQDKLYSFPINLFTLNQVYGCITPDHAKSILEDKKLSIADPKNLEEFCLANIGRELYEIFIKGYTKKQWNKDPKELPVSIIKRIPIRLNYNDRYFDDKFEGIPTNGYTEIFEKLLDNPKIKVILNTDFFENKNFYLKNYKKIIYSGKVDQYFNYSYGLLEYRSLRFEETFHKNDYQGNSIINYTDEKIPYTRIFESKFFHDETVTGSWITKEYPQDYNVQEGNEPYYPVPTSKNKEIYEKYVSLMNDDQIIFGGRLGKYQYYNMDQVVASALTQSEKF
jgi:UDP-galactopyranose mutase